jgi:hypothetical protein
MDLFELIKTITITENWPYFSDAERLDELNGLAEEAFKRETFDGYLSYVFITHQICDELIRLLIIHTRFTLQLYLIPDGFDYKFSNSDDNKDIENLMTGKLLEILKNSLEFDQKEEFIQTCLELSQIRNRLAHELTRKVKLGKIKNSASKYRQKFIALEELFDEIHDIFCLFYKDQRKDDSWDLLIDDQIQILDAENDKDEIKKLKEIIKLRKEAGF